MGQFACPRRLEPLPSWYRCWCTSAARRKLSPDVLEAVLPCTRTVSYIFPVCVSCLPKDPGDVSAVFLARREDVRQQAYMMRDGSAGHIWAASRLNPGPARLLMRSSACAGLTRSTGSAAAAPSRRVLTCLSDNKPNDHANGMPRLSRESIPCKRTYAFAARFGGRRLLPCFFSRQHQSAVAKDGSSPHALSRAVGSVVGRREAGGRASTG